MILQQFYDIYIFTDLFQFNFLSSIFSEYLKTNCIFWQLGSKKPDEFLSKLKKAIDSQDKTFLERAITESVAAGMPELDLEIQKARETLNVLEGGKGG